MFATTMLAGNCGELSPCAPLSLPPMLHFSWADICDFPLKPFLLVLCSNERGEEEEPLAEVREPLPVKPFDCPDGIIVGQGRHHRADGGQFSVYLNSVRCASIPDFP